MLCHYASVAHTVSGLRCTELVLQLLRIHGELVAAADALVADLGLTSARWQVLSLVQDQPFTVAQMARRLGLSRQAVQRSADRLATDGLLARVSNPDHKSSPLCRITESGRTVLAEARRRQERWADEMGRGLEAADMAAACRVLRNLSGLLISDAAQG